MPQVRRFAAHVRSGQHQNRVAGGVQVQIVGNEPVASTQFLFLDDRMAACDDLEVAGVFELRPAIISLSGKVRQASEHVDLGERERGLADASSFARNRRPQFSKDPALDLDHLFLRVQNFRLILLQFWSGESFRVHQRLLALVIGGHEVQVRLGNLQVVSENRIELHLERTDAGAQAFSLLDLREILLAVAAQVTELVQLGVNACRDHAAITQGDGWLGDNRLFDARAQVAQLVHGRMKTLQPLTRETSHGSAGCRDPSQGRRQCQHIARIRGLEGYAAEQSLQVEDSF